MLALSNLVFAAGLVLMGVAGNGWLLAAGWLVIGVGMAMGLYDAAFATLAGLYGREARGPITGITLIAGFASTVGWPLSALMEAEFGWRGACLVWAAPHICSGCRSTASWCPARRRRRGRQASARPRRRAGGTAPPLSRWRCSPSSSRPTWFVTGAMAAHLPRLLEAAGATPAAAVAAAALVGPAQVAARVAEFGLLRRLPSAGLGAPGRASRIRSARRSCRRSAPRRRLRSRCCTARATAC